MAATRPPIEPLASRLERASRVAECRAQTDAQLSELLRLHSDWTGFSDVWVKGILVPFIAVGPNGVFCIWPVDMRWTARQAAMVSPVPWQLQVELGDWPGKVEAVFHSPRERFRDPGWVRHVFADEESAELVDVVIMGDRLDEQLPRWEPIGGVFLDAAWVGSLEEASRPRWWRSDEGARPLPPPPADESV